MADYARGERLRELRERKHASQEAVAFEVGVSVKTLRTWEHGGKIRWPNAKRLAQFYDVDPEALVSREALQLPPLNLSSSEETFAQLDRIEGKLDQLLELLTDTEREESILEIVDRLVSRVEEIDESLPPRNHGRSENPGAKSQQHGA